MDQLAKLAFVITQLATYSGAKKNLPDSTFVACPFHSESTPSFRIFHGPSAKSPGFGKCYGCGKAVAWNEHSVKLGLKPWAYAKPTELFAHALKTDLGAPEEEVLEYSELPTGKIWRSIKTDLLISAGCKKVVNQWGRSYVYMPVKVLNQLRGYIKAQLRKPTDGSPSYINSKGAWSSDYGLFLYDHVVQNKPKTLILVEGPRDGLRLLGFGLPAISILGTQSWSKRKTRLIELSGATDVVLAFDGDCAGLKACQMIQPQLDTMVRTHVFDLAGTDSPYERFRDLENPSKAAKAEGVSLWDPGNMPLSKVKELRLLVRKLS